MVERILGPGKAGDHLVQPRQRVLRAGRRALPRPGPNNHRQRLRSREVVYDDFHDSIGQAKRLRRGEGLGGIVRGGVGGRG